MNAKMKQMLFTGVCLALLAVQAAAQDVDLVSEIIETKGDTLSDSDTKKASNTAQKDERVTYETEKDEEVADDRGIFSFLNFSFIKKPLSLFSSDDDEAQTAQDKDGAPTEQQKKETPLERKTRRANEGNLEAQLVLGYMYLYGENGVSADYDKAFEFYKMAAEQGDPVALNNLGSLYFNGIGTKRDYLTAARLFAQAAEKGSDDAAVNLAFIYLSSQNTPEQRVEAVKLFMQAAEHGNKTAQYMLGVAYAEGFNLEKDDHKAVALIKEAANAEFDEAQYRLALMYLNGQGIAQNYGNAVKYLKAAMLQGNLDATMRLADILATGDVYPANPVRAHIYYNIAAVDNVPNAAQKRDEVRKRLKIEELLEAQAQAESFKPKPSTLTTYIRQTFGKNIDRYITTNLKK
jgi:TPR repeat protein